jgi:hypothetical protein
MRALRIRLISVFLVTLMLGDYPAESTSCLHNQRIRPNVSSHEAVMASQALAVVALGMPSTVRGLSSRAETWARLAWKLLPDYEAAILGVGFGSLGEGARARDHVRLMIDIAPSLQKIERVQHWLGDWVYRSQSTTNLLISRPVNAEKIMRAFRKEQGLDDRPLYLLVNGLRVSLRDNIADHVRRIYVTDRKPGRTVARANQTTDDAAAKVTLWASIAESVQKAWIQRTDILSNQIPSGIFVRIDKPLTGEKIIKAIEVQIGRFCAPVYLLVKGKYLRKRGRLPPFPGRIRLTGAKPPRNAEYWPTSGSAQSGSSLFSGPILPQTAAAAMVLGLIARVLPLSYDAGLALTLIGSFGVLVVELARRSDAVATASPSQIPPTFKHRYAGAA